MKKKNKGKLIALRITNRNESKLERLCEKYDMNQSEVIRKLIEEAK